MINASEFLLLLAGAAWCGFVAGSMLRDKAMWRILRDQQQRGDYWFDRYMLVVRDDWEPLSKDE